jgi:hypothetical protein
MNRWVHVLLGLGIIGCTKAAPPPASAAASPHAAAGASDSKFSEHAEFSNAALPADAVFWCHVPAPARDLPVFGELTNLGALVEPSALLKRKFGPALGGALDLSRPIDGVMFTKDGVDMDGVVAFGVADAASFAAHVQKQFALARVSAGRFRLAPKGSVDIGASCELWQGAAAVGARVICGKDENTIGRAGPFLLSPAPASANTASLHVEMPGPGLRLVMEKADRERKKPSEPESLDEARGEELGREFVKQTTDAMDALAWDLTLHEKYVDLAQEIRFEQSDALFSLLLSGRAGTHPAVPDSFWRLPTDSALAMYSEGADPAPLRKAWAQTVPRFLEVMNADVEVTPAQKLELEQVLSSTLFRGGAWEFAYGQDLKRAAAALDAPSKPAGARAGKGSHDQAKLQHFKEQLDPWFVVGLEDDPNQLLEALRRGIKLGNQDLPPKKGSKAKPKPPSPAREQFTEAPLASPSALPAGSVHYVLRTEPNKKYVPPADGSKPAALPSAVHLIAVPEGGQLWLCIAHEEASAVNHLRALLAAPSNQGLGADPTLRGLAQTPPAGLGVATIAGFIGLTLSAKDDSAGARRALSNLFASPGKGETRMPVWVTATGGGKTPRRVSYHARLPPGAIADLLHFAMAGMSD